MARCLVTGHKGYIGSRLFERLQELGHEVLGIDLQEDFPKDIRDFFNEDFGSEVYPAYWNFKPEYVFHLAAIPRVAYSIEEPVKTTKNNILAGSMVLNFARKVGAKRLIYAGSSSVVGNGDGPASPYALQKLYTEMECRIYSELYGLDTVTLRYFNVYSPDQQAKTAYATAVANWMQHIRDDKLPFITGDGEQRRDMANREDVVSANIFAMEYEGTFNGQQFDVGTGDNISLNEMKKIVEEHIPNVVFEYVAERKGDVRLTKADIQPLRDLGWEPQYTIEKGIHECFRRLKNEII
mgnify:CR=1 FL=1|tara:strand:- start:6038 stop:6922 length:885 start_codon:yes stop_codon:yes gene_type:complete